MMGPTWKQVLTLVTASLGVLTVSALPEPVPHPHGYSSRPILKRDVCIIGGGSSGTYTAIRLRDLGKSVVVVERKDRLGGHTETYTDPATHATIDYGVVVFHDLAIVRNYFGRFNISLATANFNTPGLVTELVDLDTGKVDVGFQPSDPTAALGAYAQQLAKYPFLAQGYNLPDPVPADLLLPFGDFVTKYGIDAAVPTIASIGGQGYGNILQHPTLYMMKVFGADILRSLQVGFLATALHDNSLLYEAAQASLGADVLLNSSVVSTHRDGPGYATVVVDTPAGRQIIHAQKIVVAIPPKLDKLAGFDLDANERSLFGQFVNSAYYTGLLRNSGIPDNVAIANAGVNTPDNLPALPGVYGFNPTGVPGLQNVKYGSEFVLSDEQVKSDILAIVQRLRTAGTLNTTTPEFAVFSSHNPFALRVPAATIAAGFYAKLNALQGGHRTFFTGAAWQTQDSSLIWNFTEALLPQIAA